MASSGFVVSSQVFFKLLANPSKLLAAFLAGDDEMQQVDFWLG
jgi:hypothetical protein